jgi:hypothetical protein
MMIRLKQILEQAGTNPVDKKTSKDTFKNIEKNAKWEPIVAQFSKQFKEYITKPETLINISQGCKGLLSGFKQKSGTLQNGGSFISYVKHPKVFNKMFSPEKMEKMRNGSATVVDFVFKLSPNYAAKYNPNYFQLNAALYINSNTVDGGYKFSFFIGLYKNKTGEITYGIAPGLMSYLSSGSEHEDDSTISSFNPSNPQLNRMGNIKSINELIKRMEFLCYDLLDRADELQILYAVSTKSFETKSYREPGLTDFHAKK